MKVQLAVVSDLHCHPGGHSPQESLLLTDALRAPTSEHPVESLLELIRRENLIAEALLVPGDLTNRIDTQGFISAWQFVKEIGVALKVKLIATTLGNHDVDSRKMKNPNPFHIAMHLEPRAFPVEAEIWRNCFWSNGYCVLETGDLCVLIINSVAHHHTEQEAKRGEVTSAQLEQVDRKLSELDPKRFQVALFHHHPIPHEGLGLGSDDLMKGGEPLLEMLDRHGFRLAVHGHKHYPRLRYAPVGSNSLVVFAAGSLSAVSVPMFSNTRNTFHLIDLDDLAVRDCTSQGEIRTWVFGWGRGWLIPERQSADFPAVAGFGFHSSIADLGQKTATLVSQALPKILPLAKVIEQLPQVRYLHPDGFDAYLLELETHHGISIISDTHGTKWVGILVS